MVTSYNICMEKMELIQLKSDHGEAVNISRLIESESVNDNGRKATEHDVKNILAKYTENLNQRSSKQLEESLT